MEWKEIYKYFGNNEEWKIKLEKDLQGLNYTNIPQNIEYMCVWTPQDIFLKLSGNNFAFEKVQQ